MELPAVLHVDAMAFQLDLDANSSVTGSTQCAGAAGAHPSNGHNQQSAQLQSTGMSLTVFATRHRHVRKQAQLGVCCMRREHR